MSTLILGGGLSGLSAAHYLKKHLPNAVVSLWESSQRTGGWIRSSKNEHGAIFEQAARTIRPTSEAGANTLALVEDLKLSDQVLAIRSSDPSSKNRFIYVGGSMHVLPSSLSDLFKRKPPFKKPLIIHLLNELRTPPKHILDEPVYDFVERRLGKEIADFLINPLICGICAGNSKEISVHFISSELHRYEQTHGGIIKGVLRNMFFGSKKQSASSVLQAKARKEKWTAFSFQNGLEVLPRQLTKVIKSNGVEIFTETNCEAIEFVGKEVHVHNKTKSAKCSHLFSCIPAEKLAKSLPVTHSKLSALLKSIQNVNVAIVNLHFKGCLIEKPGFGFLVPPQENLPILGVTFDSCCFGREDTVLTVMMGGFWFSKYFSEFTKDEQFYDVALSNVRKILNITTEPISKRVTVLKNCIPQYTVGHRDKIQMIQCYIKDNKLPLSICGMSYDGVGVNDVILSSRKNVENYLKTLQIV